MDPGQSVTKRKHNDIICASVGVVPRSPYPFPGTFFFFPSNKHAFQRHCSEPGDVHVSPRCHNTPPKVSHRSEGTLGNSRIKKRTNKPCTARITPETLTSSSPNAKYKNRKNAEKACSEIYPLRLLSMPVFLLRVQHYCCLSMKPGSMPRMLRCALQIFFIFSIMSLDSMSPPFSRAGYARQ